MKVNTPQEQPEARRKSSTAAGDPKKAPSKPKAKPSAKSKPKPRVKADPKPKAETKTKSKAEAKPRVKPETGKHPENRKSANATQRARHPRRPQPDYIAVPWKEDQLGNVYWRIEDDDTGRILDNANGAGYRSKKLAERAWRQKLALAG